MQMMPVQTKAQVLSLLQEYQQDLHRFGVSRCGVFGSFVRDRAIRDRRRLGFLSSTQHSFSHSTVQELDLSWNCDRGCNLLD